MITLPTWLLYRAMRRWLPESHPWKATPIGLDDWEAGATPLCRDISLVLWFNSAAIVVLVMVLAARG